MKLTRQATTETIKEALTMVNDDLSIDGIVFDMLLSELELRLSENDFIAFCEGL